MRQNYLLGNPVVTEASDLIEPVLLPEMKVYLRVSPDETFNDTLITQLIKTARQQLEGFLNIALVPKTVAARLQNDAGYMQLPFSAPNITITSVVDDNGNTVSSNSYKLKGSLFSAYGSTATPANNFYSPCNFIAVVTYDVSYGDAGIPTHFKTAIMQQVAWLYERRGDEMDKALSPLVKISLAPYRLVI